MTFFTFSGCCRPSTAHAMFQPCCAAHRTMNVIAMRWWLLHMPLCDKCLHGCCMGIEQPFGDCCQGCLVACMACSARHVFFDCIQHLLVWSWVWDPEQLRAQAGQPRHNPARTQPPSHSSRTQIHPRSHHHACGPQPLWHSLHMVALFSDQDSVLLVCNMLYHTK